jgi:hypothetical protein
MLYNQLFAHFYPPFSNILSSLYMGGCNALSDNGSVAQSAQSQL